MTEEIMAIRSAVDDLRDSAEEMERALDAVGKDGNNLMAKVAWLERENAKLRDAVVALWKCCAWNTNLCEWCDECDLHDTENGGCKIKRMLNKMGIEVDA